MAAEKSKKPAKMCGYLEKRGKLLLSCPRPHIRSTELKLGNMQEMSIFKKPYKFEGIRFMRREIMDEKSTITGKWKRWWCVLEGQLLLYYKSRTQYLKLSPCCGSLNVALVRCIQPHANKQIHVRTHSQLVILRASSKEKQQNWFLAFISVLPKQRREISVVDDYTSSSIFERTSHLSESYGDCNNCRSNSLSYSYQNNGRIHQNGSIVDPDFRARKREVELLRKRLPFNDINAEQKTFSDACHIDRASSSFLNHYCKRVSDTEVHTKRCMSYDNLESTGAHNRIKRFYSDQCVTVISRPVGRISPAEKSFSCNSILLSAQSHECINCDDDSVRLREEENSGSRIVNTTEPNIDESSSSRKIKKKESFNVFRKVFRSPKKHKVIDKQDHEMQPTSLETEDDHVTVTRTLREYLENQTDELSVQRTDEFKPTTDEITERADQAAVIPCSSVTEDERPPVPRRRADFQNLRRVPNCRSVSRNEGLSTNDKSPILPVKQKINSADYSSKIAELNSTAYDSIGRSFKSERNANVELDLLLLQLSMITQEQQINESSDDKSSNSESDEDPDYDFPIPHASLVIDRTFSERKSENNNRTNMKTENDFIHNFGVENLLSSNITPDSLEAPWMLVNSKQLNRWSPPDNYILDSDNQSESDSDSFLDSLDTRAKFTYTYGHQ